jgi:hypothetical protein
MKKPTIELEKMTREIINGEINKRAAQNITTLIPFFGGVMLTAFWGIFDAGMLFVVLGPAAMLLSPAVFAYHKYGRAHVLQKEYIDQLKRDAEEIHLGKMKEIKNYFENRDYTQPSNQLTKIKEKMSSFEEVLLGRFEKHELAYARYHSVAEQTLYSVTYNLNEVMLKLKAIDKIDVSKIKDQIAKINKKELDKHDELEVKSLEERLELYNKANEKIKESLSKNEQAMTELDKFSLKVSELNTDGFDGDDELTIALKRISELSGEASEIWGK